MTKYLLHGGRTRVKNNSNDAFFRLMADELPENGIWLGIFFARESNEQKHRFDTDVERLEKFRSGRSTQYVLARVEKLKEQIKMADVIYIAGGKTHNLLNILKENITEKELCLESKMYAGSSAGMYVLGQKFHSQKTGIGEGFGVVPFNTVAHHCAAEYLEFQSKEPVQSPALKLHETQFCVMEL